MRYASIRSFDISNGDGVGVALFTQGCKFHCKGCFNPETWDLNAGRLWTEEVEEKFLDLMKPDYITRVSILGGEPLLDRNIEALCSLCIKIKDRYPKKKIWLYSGYTYEVIKERIPEIIDRIDILVDGTFIEELKDLNLPFRGSSNQRVIDVMTGKEIY